MTAKEELNLILTLIRKYNLPISPILEYAIQERISEVTDVTIPDNNSHVIIETCPESQFAYNVIDKPIKESFKKYLFDHRNPSTARIYISYLNRSIRKYINKLIDSKADSVFSFTNIESVRSLISRLKSSEEFMNENRINHNSFTAALGSYQKFIEHWEISQKL